MKRRLSKLFKAPPDDLDDLLLLFLRHLVVAGQAQTSFKDVRTHVLHAAVDSTYSQENAPNPQGHTV